MGARTGLSGQLFQTSHDQFFLQKFRVSDTALKSTHNYINSINS
jgi:hypothetical protein